VDELLALDTPTDGRAIWAYRGVDGRVRSALAKFGDANLRVLTEIASGRGRETWQAQRLSPESLELIGSFDWASMSAASAAALFWYVRNSLFFDLGLERRDDVLLSSYDALVSFPEAGTRRSRPSSVWSGPRLWAPTSSAATATGRRVSTWTPAFAGCVTSSRNASAPPP